MVTIFIIKRIVYFVLNWNTFLQDYLLILCCHIAKEEWHRIRTSHSTTLYGHGVQSEFFLGRLKFSVCDAICRFNSGTQSRRHLLENIGILSSRNMFYGLERENRKRILDAGQKVFEKYKHRQLFLFSQKKKQKVISKNYIPGAFGLNKAPHLECPQKTRIKIH